MHNLNLILVNFSISLVPSSVVSEMEKWVPKPLLSKNISRFVQFAAAASQQAMEDSGWKGDKTMAGMFKFLLN